MVLPIKPPSPAVAPYGTAAASGVVGADTSCGPKPSYGYSIPFFSCSGAAAISGSTAQGTICP